MIYTPIDIKWIKNITDTVTGSAYMDQNTGEFTLHFPNKHKVNVTTPKVDELIILHQKIGGKRFFTHLVTPIDDQLIEEEDREKFKFGRRVKVIAFIPVDGIVDITDTEWSSVNFQGVCQGNACKIDHIKSANQNTAQSDILRVSTWNTFKRYFLDEYFDSVSITDFYTPEAEEESSTTSRLEGKLRLITHLVRERNRSAVQQKKNEALKSNSLYCEVCKFSFVDRFGVEFIECHHIIPISESGERVTAPEDLALVCPNCHRMLHRKFDGEYLSIDELRELLNCRKK